MTDILFFSTIILDFAGFLFSGIFLFINISGRYTDLASRNESVLKISKFSMITSIIFAFLTCLLSDASDVATAISVTASLFSIIAITWLIVILVCGLTMLLTVISKKYYRPEILLAVRRLFKLALPAAIICLVLTWLFS